MCCMCGRTDKAHCRNVIMSETQLLRMDVLQMVLSMTFVPVVELLVIICIICLYLQFT